MKRMTKEERLAKEELTRTQVLNLSELERVARYEKRVSKKPAIFLAVLGIMCITFGASYNSLTAFIDDAKNPQSATGIYQGREEEDYSKPIETLSCQYTNLGSVEGMDTTVNMTLIFNNGKLNSYTKVMSVKPTLGKEAFAVPNISNLFAAYQGFEILTIPGYKILSTLKDNGFETVVSLELKELDTTQLNIYHQSNVVTKAEFSLNDSKEDVLKTAKDLDYFCQ